MSEPTLPDGALGPVERLHPLFLLSGFGRFLRGLSGAYAYVAYLVVSGQFATALMIAIAALAITAVSVFLYWQSFQYRVGESEIRIDHGIVSRTHRSIPFDRVTDVDIVQRPFARMLGLAEVKFETGGGGAKEEGVLRAVTLQRAEELRALVRTRRSGAPQQTAAAPAERPPIYAMSLGRLLLAGLFNFSLAIFAALFGATQTVGEPLGIDPFSERFWRDALDAGSPVTETLRSHRAVALVAGLVLLLVLGALTGIVRTGLRHYGFRLDRSETGLRRRSGLLTLTDVTLPIRRVQAAIVGSGPIRAAFGWSDLRLQSLAAEEAGTGDHVIAPLVREEEVGAILPEMGWRPLAGSGAWVRVSPAYFWTFATALSPLLVVAAVEAVIFPIAGAGLLAVYAVALFGRWLGWRRTGWVLDTDRLLMRSGWLRRRLVILPIARIQSIELRESFVSRWFGICELMFGVAGGRGLSAHNIPALPRETARQLRDQLLDLPS